MRDSSNLYMKAGIWLIPPFLRDFRDFKTSDTSASETSVILYLWNSKASKTSAVTLKEFLVLASATADSAKVLSCSPMLEK